MPADTDDRGSASLQAVILAPGLLFLLAVILQAAWWHMAQAAAHAAAAEGVRAARVHHTSVDAGRSAALNFAADVARGQLLAPAVDTTGTTATTIVITVRGKAPSFVPGFSPVVAQTVRAPRERFTVPQGGERR